MESAEKAVADRILELAKSSGLALQATPDARGVALRLPGQNMNFYHSFVTGALARRAGQSKQALLRACNNRARDIDSVLDLTAGWGADSLTLARHGQNVCLLEQNPLIHAILSYSRLCLEREDGPDGIAERMLIENIEAGKFLCTDERASTFDCIYLDPMFPAHKSGAKPSAEMQILQMMTENHAIEDGFRLARANAKKRVVVKRPLKAPNLDDAKADIVYREKTIRFDVYLA